MHHWLKLLRLVLELSRTEKTVSDVEKGFRKEYGRIPAFIRILLGRNDSEKFSIKDKSPEAINWKNALDEMINIYKDIKVGASAKLIELKSTQKRLHFDVHPDSPSLIGISHYTHFWQPLGNPKTT